MAENIKSPKTAYEAPVIVDLGELACDAGYCGPGSADAHTCDNGNVASVQQSRDGSAANLTCSNGGVGLGPAEPEGIRRFFR